jgi:hypothetical protein
LIGTVVESTVAVFVTILGLPAGALSDITSSVKDQPNSGWP